MSTPIRPRFSITFAFALFAVGCGDDDSTGGGGLGAAASSAGGGQGGASETGGGGAGGAGASGGSGGEGAAGGEGGAGGEGPTPDDFGGGTRLRARFFDGGGGARQWISFVDTELDDTQCYPGLAEDGSLRCIPYSEHAALFYFADSGCTEPFVLTESACDVPSYVSVSTPWSEGCVSSNDGYAAPPIRSRVFSVGEVVTPTVQYWMVGDECQEGPPIAIGLPYRAVSEVLSPAELAPLEAVVEPRDGGLAAEVMRSEDGAFVVVGARTTEDEAPCHILGGRCYPPHVAANFYQDGYFADAACSTELLVAQSTWGCEEQTPTPSLALVGSLGQELVAHELGAASTAAAFFAGAPADCDPVDPSLVDDMRFYALGPALDPETFPAVERAQRGDGRLTVDVFQTPGGGLLRPGSSFYDTEIAVDASSDPYCQLARDVAGSGYRCVPGTFSSHSGFYFTDAACTNPFWYPTSVAANYYVDLEYACGELTIPGVVREVVDYDGPVFGSFGGQCNPAGSNQGHAAGAVVDDVFAAVTKVTE